MPRRAWVLLIVVVGCWVGTPMVLAAPPAAPGHPAGAHVPDGAGQPAADSATDGSGDGGTGTGDGTSDGESDGTSDGESTDGDAVPDPVHPDPPIVQRDGYPQLEESLACHQPAAVQPGAEPVLLVPGTFTTGPEQYAWTYGPALDAAGLPWCTITYPFRGQGDMQIAAEYVAYGVQQLAARSATGRVDLVGHSQGASMPRWAIKYWPTTVQAVLDDVVLQAGPMHGVALDTFGPALAGLVRDAAPAALRAYAGMPAAYWQLAPDSAFNRRVNLGDETPGGADYTSIYAYTDELVQPSFPDATATARLADGARNVNVQAVCPGRAVDHVSIGTTDGWVLALTVQLLTDDDGTSAVEVRFPDCAIPDQRITAESLRGMQEACCGPSLAELQSDFRPVPGEPPTTQYAIDQDARDGLG